MKKEKKTAPEESLPAIEASVPNDDQLKRAVKMAVMQIDLEDQITDLTEKMEKASASLKSLTTDLFPELMKELGIKEFTLEEGFKVKVKKVVGGSISKARREEAFRWFRENGHGSLVKRELTAKFGMGEEKKALKAEALLKKLTATAKMEESVHSQTLGAFIREQLEKGTAIPMDLLGVFQYDESKIERPA